MGSKQEASFETATSISATYSFLKSVVKKFSPLHPRPTPCHIVFGLEFTTQPGPATKRDAPCLFLNLCPRVPLGLVKSRPLCHQGLPLEFLAGTKKSHEGQVEVQSDLSSGAFSTKNKISRRPHSRGSAMDCLHDRHQLYEFVILVKVVGPCFKGPGNRPPGPVHSQNAPNNFLTLNYSTSLVAHEIV